MARLWQSIVPEEAMACPFLIHGMLAVSALHVAGKRPSHRFRYERCCRQHQNQAIPEYRQAIQTISPDSVGPIFAMSYLVSILSLAAISDNALRDEERHTEVQTSIDDIMAVVTVIRGIQAIVRPAHLRRRLMNSPYYSFDGTQPSEQQRKGFIACTRPLALSDAAGRMSEGSRRPQRS
jgi:hypothetical protein